MYLHHTGFLPHEMSPHHQNHLHNIVQMVSIITNIFTFHVYLHHFQLLLAHLDHRSSMKSSTARVLRAIVMPADLQLFVIDMINFKLGMLFYCCC